MAAAPPRPDVTVGSDRAPGHVDIVISRDGKGRSYRVPAGDTVTETVKRAVEAVISDPYTREWIP